MLDYINKKLHTPLWLFWLLAGVLVLRIPSFFEPYSYGDEMIYLTLGEAVRQGIPLYKGIHDNKPPLLYLLAAVAGNLFWFKAILALWHLVTVFIFWKLTEALFPKRAKTQVVATVIFAVLTTIPLLEGNIINAELFMIGPTILAFLILITRQTTTKFILLSGFLFSISSLFKIPAAFDVPAAVFLWLLREKDLNKKAVFNILKNTLILAAGFIIPIALTFVWYYINGAFREYLIAAFLQNFGYLSSWRPSDTQKPFLLKNAPLLIRAFIVVGAGSLLFKLRNKLTWQFCFISVWLFLTLFGVTLSERPYPHYLIQSVGPIALLLSFIFTRKTEEQVYAIIPLFFAVFVPFYFRFWYYPTSAYYLRFAKLAIGNISKNDYLKSYGSQVPRNYKIANFIVSSTKPYEKIFVWGDGVPVYALSKRLPPFKYVADYHISDFSSQDEVINNLKENMPTLVVTLPDSKSFPELEYFLRKNYAVTESIDGAIIWKLLSPKVRALFSY